MAGTTERQKYLFGAARTAMSNDRDWRQIGGSARPAEVGGQRRSVSWSRASLVPAPLMYGCSGRPETSYGFLGDDVAADQDARPNTTQA